MSAAAASSDEHAPSRESVAHPVDRLTLLQETRPPVIICARPADRPPPGAHPFDERALEFDDSQCRELAGQLLREVRKIPI